MKIYFYISKAKNKIDIYQEYLSVLRDDVCATDSMADSDVVAILGCWNKKSSSIASKARRMGIPYFLIPLGDLSRWNMHKPFWKRKLQKHLYQKSLAKHASGIIALSPMEKQFIERRKWNNNVLLIRSFVFSSLIDAESTKKQLDDEFSKAYDLYEANKIEKIASKTESVICRQLLLIKSRMSHKNIPMLYINQLNTLLYADDYDEDDLNDEMDRLHITKFAKSVFQVMTTRTGLTEGFMPTPASDNRKAKTIESYIK